MNARPLGGQLVLLGTRLRRRIVLGNSLTWVRGVPAAAISLKPAFAGERLVVRFRFDESQHGKCQSPDRIRTAAREPAHEPLDGSARMAGKPIADSDAECDR